MRTLHSRTRMHAIALLQQQQKISCVYRSYHSRNQEVEKRLLNGRNTGLVQAGLQNNFRIMS